MTSSLVMRGLQMMPRAMFRLLTAVVCLYCAPTYANEARYHDDLKIIVELANGRFSDGMLLLQENIELARANQNSNELWRYSSMRFQWLYEYGDYERLGKLLEESDRERIWDVSPLTTAEQLFHSARLASVFGQFETAKQLLHLVLGSEYSLHVSLPTLLHRRAALQLALIDALEGNVADADTRIRRVFSAHLFDQSTDAVSSIDILFETVKYFNSTRRYRYANFLLQKIIDPLTKILGTAPLVASEALTLQTSIAFAQGSWREVAVFLETQKTVLPKLERRPFYNDLIELYMKHVSVACTQGQLSRDFEDDLNRLLARAPGLMNAKSTHIGVGFVLACAGQVEHVARAIAQARQAQFEDRSNSLHLAILDAYVAAVNGSTRSVDEALKGVATQLLRLLAPYDSAGVGSPASLRADEIAVIRAVFSALESRRDSQRILANKSVTESVFLITQVLHRDKGRFSSSIQLARSNLSDPLIIESARSRERMVRARDEFFEFMFDLLSNLIRALSRHEPHDRQAQDEETQRAFRFSWQELAHIEFGISDLDRVISQRFSDYFSSTRDSPVSLSELTSRINPNEVVLQFTVINDVVISYCFRGRNIALSISRTATTDRQVDLSLVIASVSKPGTVSAFPFDAAQRLRDVVNPNFAVCTSGATQIQIIPDPEWLAVPFMALPIRDVRAGESFRHVHWSGMQFPISIHTSVSSLVLARTHLSTRTWTKDLVSFADPVLSERLDAQNIILSEALFSTRGAANVEAIRQLRSLPETRDEANKIASLFPSERTDVFSRETATKRQLRSLDLREYRIIHFATHALIAGELDGIAEPGLVLTPGNSNNRFNDGYLSLSEVYGLNLNADLVVLSACNTTAASSRGAERGLSGLANGFFFAGAKTVIASQWEVASVQAVPLMTSAIDALVKDQLSASHGLHRSIQKYFADPSMERFLHPSFWAVFIVIGDGGSDTKSSSNRGLVASRSTQPLGTNVVTSGALHGEVIDITVDAGGESGYAVGMRYSESVTARNVGSYLARFERGGITELYIDPSFAARNVARLGDSIILSGFTPSDKTDVEVRSVSLDGMLRWRKVFSELNHSLPVDLIVTARGTILVAFYNETIKSNINDRVLRLVELDLGGVVLSDKRIPVFPHEPSKAHDLKGRFLDDATFLLILNRNEPNSTPRQSNHRVIGAPEFACGLISAAIVLNVSVSSGEVTNLYEASGRTVSDVYRDLTGEYIIVGAGDEKCRFGRRLFVDRAGLRSGSLFSVYNGLDIVPSALRVSETAIYIVGRLRSLAEHDPVFDSRRERGWVAASSLSEIRSDIEAAEEFWDRPGRRSIAFMLKIDRNSGALMAHTFLDSRARSFIDLHVDTSGRWIGWGFARGRGGWVFIGEQ